MVFHYCGGFDSVNLLIEVIDNTVLLITRHFVLVFYYFEAGTDSVNSILGAHRLLLTMPDCTWSLV